MFGKVSCRMLRLGVARIRIVHPWAGVTAKSCPYRGRRLQESGQM
jgi:hypothetical protein